MSKQAILRSVVEPCLKSDLPDIRPGDTLKVHTKVIEGEKERIQIFEGVVLALKNGGVARNVTVRKSSYGIGVERTFPLHSPYVDKFEVTRRSKVRRAKLYYLRDLSGKKARLKEIR
jgi:large subunit ribosomal protein L19